MDANPPDPPVRAGIETWGDLSSGLAVGMGAGNSSELMPFHRSAPKINPATKTKVTAQLMTLKRFFFRNDESLDIRWMILHYVGQLVKNLVPDSRGIPGLCERGR